MVGSGAAYTSPRERGVRASAVSASSSPCMVALRQPEKRLMLRSLFVDMNSYFASVEQQLSPDLRGRPIAVAPITGDSGCCIACSYEAKAFGVRTGVRVAEAKQLCPDVTIVPSRPRTYVRMHHRILDAARRVAPIHSVHSIDEFSIELMRNESPRALDLAREIKDSIRAYAGSSLRCSIGIAPNKFLAKTATEIEKPDGLVALDVDDLPGRLRELEIDDIPGIGKRMGHRLRVANVLTMEDLYERSEREMHKLWGSVLGSRMYHELRGANLNEIPMRTRTLGHEHVLEPENRTDAGSRAILMRLATKASARLRHTGYLASAIDIHVRCTGGSFANWGSSWHGGAKFDSPRADTVSVLRAVRELWHRRPPGEPKLVGVTLGGLIEEGKVQPSLFDPPLGERERLWRTVDQINEKLGTNTVYPGVIHGLHDKSLGGIAFHVVPDLTQNDGIGEHMTTNETEVVQGT